MFAVLFTFRAQRILRWCEQLRNKYSAERRLHAVMERFVSASVPGLSLHHPHKQSGYERVGRTKHEQHTQTAQQHQQLVSSIVQQHQQQQHPSQYRIETEIRRRLYAERLLQAAQRRNSARLAHQLMSRLAVTMTQLQCQKVFAAYAGTDADEGDALTVTFVPNVTNSATIRTSSVHAVAGR